MMNTEKPTVKPVFWAPDSHTDSERYTAWLNGGEPRTLAYRILQPIAESIFCLLLWALWLYLPFR